MASSKRKGSHGDAFQVNANKRTKIYNHGTGVRAIKGHTNLITSVHVTPDGLHVVSGSTDKTIRITRIKDGELVREIRGHTETVMSVCVTPDGKHVVSGSMDRSIRITPNPVYVNRLLYWRKVFGRWVLNKFLTTLNKTPLLDSMGCFFHGNPGAFNVVGRRLLSYLV